MRTYLVPVLVITVLLAGCTSGTNDTTEAPANDTTPPDSTDETTITFDGDTFSPADITITAGTTVRFEAINGASMWVASDVHPSHQEYDGTSLRQHCTNGQSTSFDQCTTGSTYTLTFDTPGTYGYHNHQPPTPGGTITVQEN